MGIKQLVPILFLTLSPAAAQSLSRIGGDYVEVRSSHVFTCGCVYSGELVTGGKEAILAWRIRTDSAEASLAGLKAVAVVTGERNLSIEGTPRKSALYLDGAVSRAQEKALVILLQKQYSHLLGEIVSVRKTPLRFERSGSTFAIEIPKILKLRARKSRLPEDAHLGSLKWHDPFIPTRGSELYTVLHEEYGGDDLPLRWRTQEEAIRGYGADFVLP